MVGSGIYYILQFLGSPIAFLHALIFGALISPTDPVAILGILTKTSIAKSLKIKITGESLFNDGVGYVVFLSLTNIAMQGNGQPQISFGTVGLLFIREVGGAVLLGFLLGKTTAFALSKINQYETEVLLTLAMVMGGYAVAGWIGASGPISMVVGGIFIAKCLNGENAMSETTKDYVQKFWELIDVLLNAILFLLIGLKILQVEFDKIILYTGVLAILLVLVSRYFSLTILIQSMKKWVFFESKGTLIMTWGGLKGGISIAMAISLSEHISKNIFIGITYIVVLFSILVQGLTLERLIRKIRKP